MVNKKTIMFSVCALTLTNAWAAQPAKATPTKSTPTTAAKKDELNKEVFLKIPTHDSNQGYQ